MSTTVRSMQWPFGSSYEDLIGAGNTSTVVRLDAVAKFFHPSDLEFLEREKLVYERLGRDHDGIVHYFGVLENAILLRYASHTSIRQYTTNDNHVPFSLKLRWVEQLFDAVRFIHSRGVLHADISCNNVFIDENFDIKLGDFAGSVIDDLPHLICYETSHQLPGHKISTKTELFALGSTVYEIMTGSRPHEGLPDHEIEAALSKGHFPDLESVPVFRNTIMKCWTQKYATVEEALADIRSEVATFNKEPRIYRLYGLLRHRSVLIPFLLATASLAPLVGWVRRWRSLSQWRRTLRAFTRPLRGAHSDLFPAFALDVLAVWAVMSVPFTLLALIPCLILLEMMRRSSAGVVPKVKVQVIAHINREGRWIGIK